MYGSVSINGTWRLRSNRELETLYNRADFVAETKRRRIEWLGHILRRESSRVPQVLDGRPEGKQRLRLLDDVVNDLRHMGIRKWRKKAEDGREWAGLARETKVKFKRTIWPNKKKNI
jgi:hypothetical protein